MFRSDEDDIDVPAFDDPVWTTLVRFSRTPLASDEAAELERWIGGDESRREIVRAVQRIASVTRRPPRTRQSSQAWNRVRARLAGGDAATGAVPAPFAPLSLAARRRGPARRLAVAAALAASVAIVAVEHGRIAQLVSRWTTPAVQPRELATQVGQRTTVHLEDGSTVILGPLSTLRYGKLTGTAERSVQLEGEAYFSVAPDAAHPFRVLASYATIQVVGTAFDVRAYPSDTVVQVLTTHGRVALRSRAAREEGGGALVERGQRGTVDTSGYVRVVSGADVESGVGWTTGQLSYQLVPLGELLTDLGRWYDVRFTLANPALANVRVTIAFDSATTDDMVSQLASVLDVRYERHGNSVRLGAP